MKGTVNSEEWAVLSERTKCLDYLGCANDRFIADKKPSCDWLVLWNRLRVNSQSASARAWPGRFWDYWAFWFFLSSDLEIFLKCPKVYRLVELCTFRNQMRVSVWVEREKHFLSAGEPRYWACDQDGSDWKTNYSIAWYLPFELHNVGQWSPIHPRT